MKAGAKINIELSDFKLTEQTFRKLMRASRLIRQIMEPFFESHGISVSQWVVMCNLFDWEGKTGNPVRLVDLSNQMLIRQPTLTVVVTKLVLQGLVERVMLPGDRRERRFRLTPQGKELIAQLSDLCQDKIKSLLSPWDVQEKQQALELLKKLVGELEVYVQSEMK